MKKTLLLISVFLCAVTTSCGSAKLAGPTEDPPGQIFVDSLPEIDPEDYLYLFEYDQNAPLDVKEMRNWQVGNTTWIEFTYASPKGGRVPATLVVPNGKGPFAGVLLQHGMPSDRQSLYELAGMYANYGLEVMLVDAPFNRPENSDRIWPRGVPLTFKEQDREDHIQLILDLRRAVDLLESRSEIDTDRLAYIGLSYGGMLGGLLAGVEHRIQAYVLVVGDGGLVTHLTGPDDEKDFFGSPFYMLTDDRKERWLETMWPLESIHYVGFASPAAILYQNGTRDSAVPFYDALRFQEAGSEPKEILWYDATHSLTRESMADQIEWLHRQVGAGTVFFAPRFDASARMPWVMLAWFLLTIIALGYSIWELSWRYPAPWAVRLPWWLAIALTGPIGLLAYVLAPKLQARISQPSALNSTWRSAFALSMWSIAVNFPGIVISSLIIFNNNSVPALAQLVLIYISARVSATIGIWLLNRLSIKEGYRIPALSRPYLAHLIVTTSVLTGAIFVSVFLSQYWFSLGPTRGPLFWSFYAWLAVASILVTMPFHAWLVKKGILSWGDMVPVGEFVEIHAVEPKKLSWYKAFGALVLSYGSLLLFTITSVALSSGVTIKDVLGIFMSV